MGEDKTTSYQARHMIPEPELDKHRVSPTDSTCQCNPSVRLAKTKDGNRIVVIDHHPHVSN